MIILKKLISVFIILIILCGCSKSTVVTSSDLSKNNAENTENQVKGVWITYNELNGILESDNFKSEFENIANNCESFGITDMFIHTVPYHNSYYKSDYLPLCENARRYDFDILQAMIDICHSKNIKVHAWLNPYRVRTADSDTEKLNKQSPAYSWLTEKNYKNQNNVCVYEGIYLNPASSVVKKLILDVTREIINNYDVDGIHIDDYFYPTTSADFDKQSYESYKEKTKNPLSLEDFRTFNVTDLVSQMYSVIKSSDKNVVFSISPTASLRKNTEELYADVISWCQTPLADMIIPQLYFGFDYPDKDYRFDNLLKVWKNLTQTGKTKLLIGLGVYKLGTTEGPDAKEWKNGTFIIAKQVDILKKDSAVSGFVYFSYSSLFSQDSLNTAARNLIENK